MMKLFRLAVLLCFAAVAVLFLCIFVKKTVFADRTVPEITLESDSLTVVLGADETELLNGVAAYDKKDGDISDSVLIESISDFTEPGKCVITYVVADSDCHVVHAQRELVYDGYSSPVFTMNSSLCFSMYEHADLKSIIGASDCLQGDISSAVVLSSTDYKAGAAGIFTVTAEVTNERGDTVTLDFPLYVENVKLYALDIELENYILYVKKGTTPDFKGNIISVTDADGNAADAVPQIETAFDAQTEGVYSVHYYATDTLQRTGHSILTVVVE